MRRLILFLACTMSVAACGGSADSGVAPPATIPTPTPTVTNAVDVNDNFFSPADVSVNANTAVTWTWKGAAQHNVTFEDGQGSSSTKATGTLARAFGVAGTSRYRCTIHSSSFTSGMVGTVVAQ